MILGFEGCMGSDLTYGCMKMSVETKSPQPPDLSSRQVAIY